MIVVVDASVAAKWYLPEEFTDEAERLLDGSFEIHAPELIVPEFGNIIWKNFRKGNLTQAEANSIVRAFGNQKILLHGHRDLMNAAFTGAQISGHTVYDWSYMALAVSLSCRFVTADEQFYNGLKSTALKKHLLWIGDI